LKNGTDWQDNKYNDDIAWMVLVSVRGYLLTGNLSYLNKAKEQFDKMYARAFEYSYGGGMLWYYTKTTKNACINGPSMVACCYLAQATGDSAYYNKAISLYTWSKLYLFDAATGKVNDNVDLDKKTGLLKISTWSSTYNQGTYLGAALKQVEAEVREGWERLIVITDEQSHDQVPAPHGKGYVVNVASNRNGVGYGAWTHIDGWSEAVVEYIAELETVSDDSTK